jgi:hypothetical protein
MMHPVGMALGLLIGVVSGVACVLLLAVARRGQPDLKSTAAIIAELLAIPTFWFGGPWVTTAILQSVSLADIVPSYMLSLSVIFTLIALYPLIVLVRRLGQEIGRVEGAADGR